MQSRHTIGILAALILILSPALDAQKLRGVVGYNVRQIAPRLAKAEKLLEQGDKKSALSYFDSAKTQWAALLRDYKGKFDPKHPEIVGMQKAFDSLGTKLEAAGLREKESKPEEPSKEQGAAAVKAPPAAMLYVMKQIHGNLDGARQSVQAQQLQKAQAWFKTADENWTAQQKWNKGKYDPKHPAVVALATKHAQVKSLIEGLTAESAGAAKTLPAVLAAILDSQKQLSAAYQASRASFRNVSSLMSDFDSGREQNVDKLRLKVDELRLRAERVNALLPGALAAAKAFRKQYPDFNTLGNLVKDGRRAGQAVERLERFPKTWLADSKRLVDEALDYAHENTQQFGIEKLSTLEGSDELRKKLAADDAQQWVLQYSAFLLDVIPSILPDLPKDAQATLPEFAAARQGFENRAKPMRDSIEKVTVAVVKIRKDVAGAERRRLEQARFPTTSHSAGAADKHIRRAWTKVFKDRKLLRLSIYLPYEVRSEARWHNKSWVVNTYRYIGANCLAQLPSGKFMVYRMNFRNTKQGDGSWSELAHRSVGHVYEILKENVDK